MVCTPRFANFRTIHAALGCLFLTMLGCGGGGANVSAGPMPDGGNWTGVYFSPQYGEMHMVQSGTDIRGTYKKDERSGTLQGETDGNLMRFEWKEFKAMVSNRPQETVGHGYFHYMIDPADGSHVLKGRWGLDDDDSGGGEWNAYRSKSREPDPDALVGKESSGGEGGDYEDEEEESEDEGDDEIF
ncbi:MAG: hypothetical protein OEZ06_09545 [Myxococcales bacterium]|nr:hypothetical protein [Myxococcales bacterium]